MRHYHTHFSIVSIGTFLIPSAFVAPFGMRASSGQSNGFAVRYMVINQSTTGSSVEMKLVEPELSEESRSLIDEIEIDFFPFFSSGAREENTNEW